MGKYSKIEKKQKPKTLLEALGSQEELWKRLNDLKVGQGITLDRRTGRVLADTCVNRFGMNWKLMFGRFDK